MGRCFRLVVAAWLGWVLVGWAGRALAHPLDLIHEKEQAGELDAETAWEYKILALHDPSRLPEELWDAAPTREATLVRFSLFQQKENLSAPNKALLWRYAPVKTPRAAQSFEPDVTLSGPLLQTDVGAYRIHYTQSGQDAVSAGVLDNVKQVVQETLALQRDTLGYTLPPPDVDGFYHVYLSDREGGSAGVYGYVQPVAQQGDNPNSTTVTETDSLRSYMVLDNDFATSQFSGDPVENLKITFAHEHYHAIQFGYSGFGGNDGPNLRWLMESAATWMETKAYPSIFGNYAEYAAQMFEYPEVNFFLQGAATPRLREYGSFLVHVYLDEHDPGGTAVQRSILNRVVQNPAGPPLEHYKNAVEQETGYTSLATLVQEYFLALLLRTSSHATGKYTFKNAAQLKNFQSGKPLEVWTSAKGTFEGSPLQLAGEDMAVAPFGANYLELVLGAATRLTVNAGGAALVAWPVSFGESGTDTPAVGQPVNVPAGGSATVTLAKGAAQRLVVFNPAFSPGDNQKAAFTVLVVSDGLACAPACSLSLNVDLLAAARQEGKTAPDVVVDVVKNSGGATCLKSVQAPARGDLSLALDDAACSADTLVDVVIKNIPAGFTRSAQGEFTCAKAQTLSSLLSAAIKCELATPGTAGDANGDGAIDLKDLGVMKQGFGGTGAAADFNKDGKVDLKDLGVIKKYFNLRVD